MTSVRHAVRVALRSRKNVGLAVALSVSLSGVAFAQEQPAASSDAGTLTLDEVTVTGSRIRRTTDFDTANPTTVVDETYIKNLGLVNVGDVVAQLPANLSNNTPNTTGNANFFAGSTIANLRGLNPFFGSRTLTLVNSRRFVPTNQGDGVDLNFIPSVLIDRVDIVTGGASAAYGSGAISGVNNIFLNRKLDGGKLEVDYGLSEKRDGADRHIGAAYGLGLLDDRAHLVVGVEVQNTDAVGCYKVRDWCAEGNGFVNNLAGTDPRFLLATNVRANQMSTTGTFYNNSRTATTTQQLDGAGTGLVPFNLGLQPLSGASALNAVPGGDGRSIYQYTNLRAPVDRKVGTATFTMAVTDSVNMNVDLSYGKVETINRTGANDAQNIFVADDNAFVNASPALAAFVTPTGARLNKDWTSQVDSFSRFTTDVKRAAIGFDGKFGTSSWGWDAYYQYGETNREQFVNDNRHLVEYNMAVDAVVNPATGQTVCRVSLPGGYAAAVAANPTGGYANVDPRLANGCVALNAFGNGPVSQAAHNYAFGILDENLEYKQQVLALNVSGDLFEGFGAGAIQGALGAEYRTEKGKNIAAQGIPDYVRTDYLIQYGESFAGDVDVAEGYAELNLPVLRDVPGARKLEFNLASRISKYDNQGKTGTSGLSRTHNLFTWKIQGLWDPIDWLRVRATQSRDARAANFRELYYRQVINAGGTFGYCGPAGTQVDPCVYDLRGNVNLRPERSDTTTMGLVFTPKEFLPGFQFAADYFRINVQDAINQASSRVVLDGCPLGVGPPETCAQISYVGGDVTNVDTLTALAYNGKGYTYKGVDFTSNYLWAINDTNNINFRLIATKMIDQKFQQTAVLPVYNVVGQTGTANSFLSDNQPSPDWIGTLSATYNTGPLAVTGQMRYISDGVFNIRAVTPNDPGYPAFIVGGTSLSSNHVPSYQVFTLSGNYTFEHLFGTNTVQLFGVVSNLLNRDPPIAVGNGANGNGGTNPIFFDTMGRSYRVGVRATF